MLLCHFGVNSRTPDEARKFYLDRFNINEECWLGYGDMFSYLTIAQTLQVGGFYITLEYTPGCPAQVRFKLEAQVFLAFSCQMLESFT